MTKCFPYGDNATLDHFAVTAPALVAETDIAFVWKVLRADGTPAALKIYKNGDMQDEGPGFDLLAAMDGRGAVRLLGTRAGAVLLEWLDGPALGDLTRDGQDDAASEALIEVALTLHQMPPKRIATLPDLERRFVALFQARFAEECPAGARASLRAATALAQRLLATQSEPRPLHGDLHHDNIKRGDRGYLAYDAKGVWGDRHYELASALRNPLGAEDQVLRQEVILHRARLWADRFGTTPLALLEWAAAHAALSLAWTYNGQFDGAVLKDIGYVDQLLSLVAGVASDQGA